MNAPAAKSEAFVPRGGGMRVDYWELGNEVYGRWDKGHMSGRDYAKKVKEYSTFMKQVDPTIKIGADWGGPKYSGFDKAVIADGGVGLEEVDFKSMQSKLVPNLYLLGDVLDVNRPSGGFSLQLCWTTGWVAGTHIGEKFKK